MSTFRDVVARMAVDAEFARHARAHPDDVARAYGLSAAEATQLRGLAEAGAAGTGPMALGARLSKSGIFTGGIGALASGLDANLNDPIVLEFDDPPVMDLDPLPSDDDGPMLKLPPGVELPGPSDEPVFQLPQGDSFFEVPVDFDPPLNDGPDPMPDPALPAAPADPFAAGGAEDAKATVGGAAPSAQAGPAIAAPADLPASVDDGFGADEIAIGAAGVALGAAAGGVAGAVAAKATANNDKQAG